MPRKLQLNKETLRHLTEDDLTKVAGGAATVKTCQGIRPITDGIMTQSPVCPSGATWLMSCESNIGTCG